MLSYNDITSTNNNRHNEDDNSHGDNNNNSISSAPDLHLQEAGAGAGQRLLEEVL